MPRKRSIAALIHGYNWGCPSGTAISIAPGIAVCGLEETPIEVCYHRLCEVEHIDDGDPFEYKVFILLEEPPTEFMVDYTDPVSLLNRLCNVITVLSGSPVSMCRLLFSSNNFGSLPHTELAFVTVGQTEFLDRTKTPGWPLFTSALISELKMSWATVEELWMKNKSKGRIANALLFFYSAWRSHYMEHICLNLAVCLEILFAPHASGETTHQIAFNLSRFLATDPNKREEVYNLCRKFYGIRSAIVHGGLPDQGKIIDTTVDMFPVIVSALKKLILDSGLARVFDSEQDRRTLLKEYLFK